MMRREKRNYQVAKSRVKGCNCDKSIHLDELRLSQRENLAASMVVAINSNISIESRKSVNVFVGRTASNVNQSLKRHLFNWLQCIIQVNRAFKQPLRSEYRSELVPITSS